MVMLLCCRLPAIIKYGTKAYQQLKALGIKQIKFTKSVLDFLILKLNPLVTIYINVVRYYPFKNIHFIILKHYFYCN